jgi:hypothetical protein
MISLAGFGVVATDRLLHQPVEARGVLVNAVLGE